MDEEKLFLLQFIKLYKSLPSLWQAKCKEYNNRAAKNRDYNILIEKLKEKNPDANKETVIKKINILRTSYRRELRKQKIKLKTDFGTVEEYVPTLWCFDSLAFLGGQDEHFNAKSMDEGAESEEFAKKAKKKKFCQEDSLIKLAVEKLAGSNSQTKESDLLAKSWGTQYEEMDKSQKVIARKIISDVLFQGCLKKLQLSHTVQIHNVFNEGNTTEYYNSLGCSAEVFTSDGPTNVSNGASTSRNKLVTPKSEKQNVLFYIENEAGETAMNDSFIVPDGSSTNNCFEETSVKNYCSNSEEDNE